MSLLSKISANFSDVKLPNRFIEGGFMTMGAVKREPRANTAEELVSSIRAHLISERNASARAEEQLFDLTSEVGINFKKILKESNGKLVAAARIAELRVEDSLIMLAQKKGVNLPQIAECKGMTIKQAARYCAEELAGDEKIEKLLSLSNGTLVDIAKSKEFHDLKGAELENFTRHMSGLNPKYLGLAHDVIDLANTQQMLNTNINLLKVQDDGKSIMGRILSMLPKTSEKNPGALELTEAVINNSDATNSKYFLASLFNNDLPSLGFLSEQMKAIKELVPQIADQALSGGYTMDYSKERNFFKFITEMCRPDAKPENLRLITKVLDMIDAIAKKTQPSVDSVEVAIGNPQVIKRNMEALPYLLENAEAQGKSVDVSGFLTKNVNLD